MASTATSTISEPPSPEVSTYFAEVTDPLIDRCKEHRLLDIIGLTICTVVAGANTFVGIECFGKARRAWLEQFLELENGIPSHDTLGEMWSRVAPEEFEPGFRRWIDPLASTLDEVVAIDGKTRRGS